MTILTQLFEFFKQLKKLSIKKNLHKILFVVLGLALICTFSVYLFEKQSADSEINSLWESFWWTIVTITTVGYGDRTPFTVGGRIVGFLAMFIGIGLISIVTAQIASIFVENIVKEVMGLKRYNLKNHIVICGWNENGKKIIQELRKDRISRDKPIVVIAELDENPIEDESIEYLKGDFTRRDVLRKASIENANSAIILADINSGKIRANTDSRTVLTVLAIEKMSNTKVYTCAEIFDVDNIEHLKDAGVDEIIVSSELSGNIIARAPQCKGISELIRELLTINVGNEIYKVPIPSRFTGESFKSLLLEMQSKYDSILIAVETENGEIKINPHKDYKLKTADQLFVISEEQPAIKE